MNDMVVEPVDPIMPRTSCNCETFMLMMKVKKRRELVSRICFTGVSGVDERLLRELRAGNICRG